MVDYLRDLAPWITLGVAVELLMAGGLTENDARSILVEAIRDRSVQYRGPVWGCWVQRVEAIDWRNSLVRSVVFGPDGSHHVASTPREPITVSRADVQAMCERISALNPAPLQRAEEVHKLLQQMYDRGELVLGRGGLRKAAKQLKAYFADYELESLENIIRPIFKEWRAKSIH